MNERRPCEGHWKLPGLPTRPWVEGRAGRRPARRGGSEDRPAHRGHGSHHRRAKPWLYMSVLSRRHGPGAGGWARRPHRATGSQASRPPQPPRSPDALPGQLASAPQARSPTRARRSAAQAPAWAARALALEAPGPQGDAVGSAEPLSLSAWWLLLAVTRSSHSSCRSLWTATPGESGEQPAASPGQRLHGPAAPRQLGHSQARHDVRVLLLPSPTVLCPPVPAQLPQTPWTSLRGLPAPEQRATGGAQWSALSCCLQETATQRGSRPTESHRQARRP